MRRASSFCIAVLGLFSVLSTSDNSGSLLSPVASYGGSSKERPLLDACGDAANATASGDDERGVDDGTATKFCSEEHRRAFERCSRGDRNKVMRSDGDVPPRARSWGELRPYSVPPVASSGGDAAPPPLPRCRSPEEYLSAIKLGTRRWPDDSARGSEAVPSAFVPSDCHAPILPPSPAETCDILDRYDRVIFHGDSLTRHLRQAIYMSMRGDYVSGGIMTSDRNVRARCSCDGTFSESRLCRTYEGYFDRTVSPRKVPGEKRAMCPNATFSFGKSDMAPWVKRRTGTASPQDSIAWGPVNCADPNYKGVLLVLQGGLHWFMDANATFDEVVRPVIEHPKYMECSNCGKVRLVWLHATSQSTAMDGVFPRQSHKSAVEFNKRIASRFQSMGFEPGRDVLMLDWMNMTAGAQSSDGLHGLSGVNLAKAAQVLYLAGRWPFPGGQSSDYR